MLLNGVCGTRISFFPYSVILYRFPTVYAILCKFPILTFPDIFPIWRFLVVLSINLIVTSCSYSVILCSFEFRLSYSSVSFHPYSLVLNCRIPLHFKYQKKLTPADFTGSYADIECFFELYQAVKVFFHLFVLSSVFLPFVCCVLRYKTVSGTGKPSCSSARPPMRSFIPSL